MRVIGVEELEDLYEVDDYILTGTSALREWYSKRFEEGKFDTEKYYIMETNKTYSNGDILIITAKKTKACIYIFWW